MEEKKNIGVFEILNILAIRKKMILSYSCDGIAVVVQPRCYPKWTSTPWFNH